MTTDPWHPTPELVRACAQDRLTPAAGIAVETHLAACPSCREQVRLPAGPADRLWEGVRERVAVPAPGPAHRALRALGLPEDVHVVVAGAGALVAAWVIALGGALAVGIIAGQAASRSDAAFMLLAPLVPVLAVVAAYDATDSLRELSATTPASRVRIALVRTLAVLAVALPSMAVVSLAVPVLDHLARAWLLPSLCLTATALVLLGRWPAKVTGAVVATGWTLVVAALQGRGDVATLTAAPGQALAVLATATLVLLVAGTRHRTTRATGARR